jgi:Ser/Thr protein kinase RdoA (MazF antagonist)
MTETLLATLSTFDALTKGDPAPGWLRDGVAQAWGYPEPMTVTLIAVSENATFLVRVDGVPVAVLRVARPGYMSGAAAFESEVAWVGAVAASGAARVPSGIPTLDGTFLATVQDTDGSGWACVSYSFVDGAVLEDVTDPVPYYGQIGATTARLHAHARSWTPPPGFERHSWDLEHMVGPVARWGRWEVAELSSAELRLLGRAQETALQLLEGRERSSATWGLVHADLRPSNLMVDEAGNLTVIDFDDCGWGWYLYDFAAAFSFIEHLPSAPTMARAWVDGYREVASFSEADAVHAGALSMVRRLQMLGWTTTHRSDALPRDLWVAQTSGTVQVARSFLGSATWLLD